MSARRLVAVLFGAPAEVISEIHRTRRHARCERGSALVEFALVLPMVLLLSTGIFSFGFALNNYLELTNAVTLGAEQMSISRSAYTDPCANAVSVMQNAAPYLTQKNVKYQFVFTTPAGNTSSITGGTFPAGGPTTSPTCSGADTANMAPGGTVKVTASYPCTLAGFGFNFGCNMSAQITEIIQ